MTSTRKLFATTCATALLVAGTAYGAAGRGEGPSIQKQAALYQIERIEKTWHRAASIKNLDLFMSIWAPNATMTIGGTTYTGKQAIRDVFAKAAPFQPENHWVSDTPAYKLRASVNGDKGTLYFECHFIDVDTGKVVSVTANDEEVRKIKGKWLVTNLRASSVALGG
jgi:SnoaL-like protein